MSARPLYEIAEDIEELWGEITPVAASWVDAMRTLDTVRDAYYEGTGREVVANFLQASGGWFGQDAERIKGELSAMLRHKVPYHA